MTSSVAYWRFLALAREPDGTRHRSWDRGWGLPRAKAEADLRRKIAKQGGEIVAILASEGPRWPPGRGPIWYRRGLPMPPDVAARLAASAPGDHEIENAPEGRYVEAMGLRGSGSP